MDQEKAASVGSAPPPSPPHHLHQQHDDEDAIEDSRSGSGKEPDPESTVIVIDQAENREEEQDGGKSKGSSLDETLMVKKSSSSSSSNLEVENNQGRCSSYVVDIKCCDENFDTQKVCRICHLSAWEINGKSLVDLVQLGCSCKGELGFAHSHCAEAWFKLKGNRLCEICGESAKNITGAVDNRFMEEWNENRPDRGDDGSSERSRGCWQGKPLCNFLMACLVIAFVLPWFFRVNMF